MQEILDSAENATTSDTSVKSQILSKFFLIKLSYLHRGIGLWMINSPTNIFISLCPKLFFMTSKSAFFV